MFLLPQNKHNRGSHLMRGQSRFHTDHPANPWKACWSLAEKGNIHHDISNPPKKHFLLQSCSRLPRGPFKALNTCPLPKIMPGGGGKVCVPYSVQEKLAHWLCFADIPVTCHGYQKNQTLTLLEKADKPSPVLLMVTLMTHSQPLWTDLEEEETTLDTNMCHHFAIERSLL